MSTYEEQARYAKATALVELFKAKNADAETLRAMDAKGWKAAAAIAGVNAPSEVTKAEVIHRMEFSENLVLPADPFAGFPVFDPTNA